MATNDPDYVEPETASEPLAVVRVRELLSRAGGVARMRVGREPPAGCIAPALVLELASETTTRGSARAHTLMLRTARAPETRHGHGQLRWVGPLRFVARAGGAAPFAMNAGCAPLIVGATSAAHVHALLCSFGVVAHWPEGRDTVTMLALAPVDRSALLAKLRAAL